ncbi:hypothetical protein K5E_26390 [Enterococcus thailandicus]|uniref:hypothetical protein n=1 Tax=Enterococcus thailandicus TaxID=417368 RepID=UPI00244D982B|nr:hypothetical protein [Enterococcus thailandicus]GMC03534.1 hypothetical protein K4E_10560 [Enterococcus thailandicus]GMC10500.1 hypothetical protein K5E_26390 [Enterococcus thailandicus]
MYGFDDVLLALDHAISLKTLKSWCIKIEKNTDTKFQRRYAKNKNGRNYSYKVFDAPQLEKFQKLVHLRSENVALDKAIGDIFMSIEGKQKAVEISLSKLEFEENRENTKKLIELTKKALQDVADLKKQVLQLKEAIGD